MVMISPDSRSTSHAQYDNTACAWSAYPYTALIDHNDIFRGLPHDLYIYQEVAVDTSATCQLVGEECLPFMAYKGPSCMTVGGFHQDSTAHGSAHGFIHPHFFTDRVSQGNGDMKFGVDVIPGLSCPLLSFSDFANAGNIASFDKKGECLQDRKDKTLMCFEYFVDGKC